MRSLLLEYEKIEVILLEGAGGVFEISKPDKMIFSKKLSGRFPTETEVRAMAIARTSVSVGNLPLSFLEKIILSGLLISKTPPAPSSRITSIFSYSSSSDLTRSASGL